VIFVIRNLLYIRTWLSQKLEVEFVVSSLVDKVVIKVNKKTKQRGANRRESHSATFKVKVNYYTQTYLNIQ